MTPQRGCPFSRPAIASPGQQVVTIERRTSYTDLGPTSTNAIDVSHYLNSQPDRELEDGAAVLAAFAERNLLASHQSQGTESTGLSA